MKFLTDRNLGKLTKWLRAIGYDTGIYQGAIGREFLREGAKQGRVVLTRRRDMASRNFTGSMYIVFADTLPEQLAEVVNEFSLQLNPHRFFSICIRCNQPLSEIERSKVRDRVPPYVFQSQAAFFVCSRCNAIFWAGTHKEKMMEYLTRHNLIHRL
jgi:uncharacterized protein with PIN domain